MCGGVFGCGVFFSPCWNGDFSPLQIMPVCCSQEVWRWYACCKQLDLKEGWTGTCTLAVGHSFCLCGRGEHWAGHGKGLAAMLWVEPLVSVPSKASALGALIGGGALPFGVEGVKKKWLYTNLPSLSAFSKLHFLKRQSHFPDTVAALLWPSLKGTCYPKGMAFFLEEITLPSLPPACFITQHLISVRLGVIFFVCLDHEHCIRRLNYCAWQLCVHETLH